MVFIGNLIAVVWYKCNRNMCVLEVRIIHQVLYDCKKSEHDN
jgi:hypothetical protein